MMQIPKNGKYFSQPNDSDSTGDIWASFGVDQSENEGRLRLGKRIILNTGTPDVSQITSTPVAFINNSASVFTFAGASNVGYAFKNDATMVGTFTRDTSTGYPATIDSTKSDAVFSNLATYVSAKSSGGTNVSLYKKTFSGNWAEITTGEPNASDVYTNMLATSSISGSSRTYMSSQWSKIISLDSADSVTTSSNYTLLLDSAVNPAAVITKIIPSDDRIFIPTLNLYGGAGYVYEWDGYSTNWQNSHRLETSGALAGIVFEGVPYIVDVEGKLLAWNGGTFKEVAKLNRENNKPLVYSTAYSSLNTRFIHPNGMTVVDGKILLLIDNKNADSTSSIEETIPSGVYEFDPKNPEKGLVHKYGLAIQKSNEIANSFGNVRIASAGALKNMAIPSIAATANGQFFIGAGYYTDATTTKYGIFYDDRNDTLQKSGYIITSKLQAEGSGGIASIKNNWQKIYTLYRKFLTSGDIIEVKYRTIDAPPVEATITWTSTTTFTTTTDVSSYWTSGTGGEVEVLQGIGAGRCSHLTSVVYSAGTYTCTVDQTYTGATGTAKARFQSWKKIKIINTQLDTSDETIINNVSNWIQFKVWMSWTGKNEIEKLVIINENSYPAK